MVNENDTHNDDVEITSNDPDTEKAEIDIDSSTIEKAAQDKIKKLQTELRAVTQEKQTLNEQLQRAKADHLNAKKRLEKEKQDGIERSQIKFIESILPVCDSFRLAMSDTELWNQVDEKWRKGVEGILSQLNAVLTTYDVNLLDPTGNTFDPRVHEALSEEPVTTEEEVNMIRQVIQPGYQATINGTVHLVRPARVVVGVSNDTEENSELNK